MGIIIGILFGGIISWVISHAYYKKSNESQRNITSKLTEELKEIILKSDIEKFTVKDLNRLLEEKIINKNAKDCSELYKMCPKCGSEDLKISIATDHEHDEQYCIYKCNTCYWSDWSQ